MKNIYVLTVIVVVFTGICRQASAQALSSYTFAQSSGIYNSISGTSAGVTGDDATASGINIGFTFDYCGVNYTTVSICTNGWIFFGNTSLSTYSNNISSTSYYNFICPLWDDLYVPSYSDIQYQTSGTSPNRIFTVQWGPGIYNLSGGSGYTYNFQVKLFETTNEIKFCYGAINFYSYSSASIGIVDQTGGTGHFISVTPGSPATISMTTPNDNISGFSSTGLVYSFSPQPPVPMFYVTSTTTQNNQSVYPGASDAQIIGVEVNTSGLLTPVINVTSITFNTNGTTVSSDITDAKVYYTGGNATFSTTTQFGSTVISPDSTFTISGNVDLVTGINYFWLAYDVDSAAIVGNYLDAECTALTVADTARTPTITAPEGSRLILNAFCGTYTIDPLQPESSTNFQSIGEIVNYLTNAGISCPVIINIYPGIYEEQITIPEITGVSATNTITFQSATGDSSDVEIVNNSYCNSVFLLDGANYIIIKHLTIINYNCGNNIELVNGANNNSILNNQIFGNNSLVFSSSSTDNNTVISNNLIQDGYYGIELYGSYSYVETGLVITNNIIINQYYGGIYICYQISPVIDGNYIESNYYNDYYYGIYCYYCSNSLLITNNVIESLNEENSEENSNDKFGIYVDYSNGTLTNYGLVANNMVSLKSSSYQYGIYQYNSSYKKLYHNSVNLSGSPYDSYSCMIYYGNYNDLKNNIFANFSGGYVIYNYNSTSGFSCDYNDLYANGSNFGYFNYNYYYDLAGWKSGTGLDEHSLSAVPGFISVYNLHTNSSELNGMAIPVTEVTTDIDGELRDVNMPDIGADEYTPYDMSITSIICTQTETNKVVIGSTNQLIIGIEILTDGSLNPKEVSKFYLSNGITTNNSDISQVSLWYTGYDSNFSTANQFGSTVTSPGDTFSFSGNYTLTNGMNYFWLTYDISPFAIPNDTADATCDSVVISGNTLVPDISDPAGSRQIVPRMSGVYTIDLSGSGDYLSFNEAVADLIVRGVEGPVIFNVSTGTYNEQVTIPEIYGASAINTITFQSATGDSSDVEVDNVVNCNSVFFLDGADYITIKHLTLANYYCGYVIELSNGANNISILNNRLYGNDYIIYSGSTVDNNTVISNNLIQIYFGYYGIYLEGSYSEFETGLVISGNKILDVYYYGIYLYCQDPPVIDNNLIENNYNNNDFYGIYCYECEGIIITNNIIQSLSQSYSYKYGILLDYSNGTTTNYGIIANNMISLKSTSYQYGIYQYSSSYLKVLYNSINLTGSSYGSYSYMVYYSNNINLKNNIFANLEGGYAIYNYYSTSNFLSDYNDLYTSGPYLGRYNSSNITNLEVWKTSTGQDTHSISVSPDYVSDYDLHTNDSEINDKGIPVPEVTTDIDGEPRDPVCPDIGADEFIPSGLDIGILSVNSPLPGCGLGDENITVMVKNFASDTIYGGVAITCSFIGSSILLSETIADTIVPAEVVQFTFSDPVDFTTLQDTFFSLSIVVELVNDINPLNDSVLYTFFSGYQPPDPIVTPDTISSGMSALLQAVAPVNTHWYDVPAGGNLIATGEYFATPVLYETTVYYVEARDYSSTDVIIGNGTITNSNTSYPCPYGLWYRGAKHQFLIPASELTSAGLQAGYINSLAFDVVTPQGWAMSNFTIKMGSTAITSLTSWQAGLTQVYYVSSYSDFTGWNTHVFQTPFYWNGISNLIIETCFDNYPNPYNLNAVVRQSSTSYYSTVAYRSDGGNVCPSTYVSNYWSQRPNMKLNGTSFSICSSNRLPVEAIVLGSPEICVSDTCLFFPETMQYLSNYMVLTITNTGNYALHLDSIVHQLPEYTLSSYSNFLIPGASTELTVTFSPQTAGTYNDTLTIYNNDVLVKVCLSAVAYAAPGISVSPNPIDVTIACGDSVIVPIIIENIGGSDLDYNIQITQVSSNNETPDILLLHSDDNYGFENALVSTGMFTDYDIDQLNSNTITLNQIINYDVVVVWSNYSFANPQLFGDVLKQYVDSGGALILCTYAYTANWSVQGGILQPGYSPFIPGYTQNVSGTINISSVPNINHPVFNNITTDMTYWYNSNYSNPALNTGAILLAQDTWGNRVIAENQAGNIVGIVIYPGYVNYYANSSTKQMFANAIIYVFNNVSHVAPVSLSGFNGTIPAYDIDTVYATISSVGLNVGIYTNSLIVNSNDPLNPQITIPVTMLLDGNPVLILSTDQVEFDTIMQYTFTVGNVTFSNNGCDTLFITDITHSLTSYYLSSSQFTLLPGDSANLVITFNPQTLGDIYDTLVIINNDTIKYIYLHGISTPAPSISVNPGALNLNVNCEDSVSFSLEITNTGGSLLEYEISEYSGSIPVPMCQPVTSYSCCGIGILNVSFNTINNSSNDATEGYKDFTNLSTTIVPGHTYSLSIMTGISYSEDVYTWIDYNNNGVFESFELIAQQYVAQNGSNLHVFNITIPGNIAVYVPLRMRVLSCYSGYGSTNPCNNVAYGQYEDYTVIGRYGSLSIGTYSGELDPSESEELSFSFNSSGLYAGTYPLPFYFISNDPLNLNLVIPVSITVIGEPVISLSSSVVDFGSVMQYTSHTDTIIIDNNGCDTLFISNIIHNLPEYSLSSTQYSILPGESENLIVTFSPLTAGDFPDTLYIYNNDIIQNVILQGNCYEAPIFSVSPLSLNVSITCGDSVTIPIDISNSGGSALDYDITSQLTGLPVQMCQPYTYYTCCGIGILNFTFNTINNSSGDASEGYKDFTYLNTNVIPGQTYTMTIQTGNYYDDIRVWIDYNNNGSFETSELIIMQHYWQDYSNYHQFQVLIPQNAFYNAPLRLRVEADENGYSNLDPCSNIYYGQYEDYTVIVNVGSLDIDPVTGSVDPEQTEEILLTFNSDNLYSGVYSEMVTINTNDPLNPSITIPIVFTLSGDPDISLSAYQIDFGSIMQYTSASDTVIIFNNGCDTLFISDITHSQSAYTLGNTQFIILPYDSAELVITFNPLTAGDLPDTLYIINNDVLQNVILQGISEPAPSVSVDPVSIIANIACGDSVTIPVTIYNNGLGNLSYNAFGYGLGLVAYYPFNGNANDLSGNGNDGTVNGAILTSDRFGNPNSAYYFNGSDNYISHPTTGILGTKGTVSGWIYPYTTSWFGFWQTHNENNVNWGDWISMFSYNSTFYFRMGDGSNCCYNDLTFYTPSYLFAYQWSFITFTWQDNVMNIYINGALIATRSNANFQSYVDPFARIGWGHQQPMYGKIDEFMIFYRQLTAEEIQSLYQNELTSNLTVNPNSGIVAGEQSTQIQVTVNAGNLNEGTYYSSVRINSNDPLNPEIIIPVTIILSGDPVLSLSSNQIDFGTIQQFASASEVVTIKNNGCDTLFVTDIAGSLPEYSANINSLTILPGEQQYITITFSPDTFGTFLDNLYIYSNTTDTFISLTGVSLASPVIGVSNTSLAVSTSECNTPVIVPFSVTNTGYGDLNLEISNVNNGKCLKFGNNNSNSYVYADYWNPGSQWTLEAWVNPSQIVSGRRTIAGGFSSCADWGITLQDGHFGVGIKPADGSCTTTITSPESAQINTWYHVAATNDGYTVRLYINGQYQNQAPVYTNYIGTSGAVMIGSESCCASNFFIGLIDEVRIWNVACSQYQIQSHIFSPLTGSETGLLAYWTFEEGSGSTTTDISGHGYTGYLYGALWQTNVSEWLTFCSITPEEGTVLSGDTMNFNASFNATGLLSGTYNTTFIISSNDPVNPLINIPVMFIVNGITSVNAGPDITIYGYNSASLNSTVSGGTTPYTYLWTPSNSLDDYTAPDPVASPTSSTCYFLLVTDSYGCIGGDDIFVTVVPLYSISGSVTYNNAFNTPMSNVDVFLKNSGGVVIDTASTDANGYYIFVDKQSASYSLFATTTIPFGGISSADALNIQRHIVALQTLTGLRLTAADVNNNSAISGADALLVRRRTIGLENSFALGDWLFENPQVTINYANTLKNFKGLCVGDVNGSYVPLNNKQLEQTIILSQEGFIQADTTNIIELPLLVSSESDIGAITLFIKYSSEYLEIKGIKSDIKELIYNLTGNELRIAWSNTEPLRLTGNEPVIIMQVKFKKPFDDNPFILNPVSEITDDQADVLYGVRLMIPYISFDKQSDGYFLGINYPNPFSNVTEIDYMIPEEGDVLLDVSDMLGKSIGIIVNERQPAGNYKISFDGSSFADGMYLYRISVKGINRSFNKTRIMNIVK